MVSKTDVGKQPILERYSRTDDGAIIIEVSTGRVEDLYNNFDRNAPYIRKDLDDELSAYLVDAVSEIGAADFVIRFRFNEHPDSDLKARLTDSIRNYFAYRKSAQNAKLAHMLRTSMIFLIAGLVILGLSIILNEQVSGSDNVVLSVFAQGLTVAAWVSLWEALANFLINWTPYMRVRRVFDKIIHAPLLFDGT